ncbi:DUF2927 domain-containing protein [Paroceanicella profunda]|uniref:DUF2927 domain-containing protein n=1 Tax=Paroceanicella profunda TaxID=2579971 RepID=A0A5B8FUA4_9RHOB|nr:DUF2927 domain-containing protein [Paroceanicella profunda]QDL90670.1 DUF2927 domain-containing protein [Paroceanicella profunda]
MQGEIPGRRGGGFPAASGAGWFLRGCAGLLLAAGLSGCTRQEAAAPPAPAPQSGLALREGFALYDAALIAAGGHRVERAPADAPFDGADLARNFIRVALAVEDMPRQRHSRMPLRRWDGPIRYAVLGETLGPQDHARVAEMMGRLSRLSGLSTREVPGGDGANNMVILVLDEGEVRALRGYALQRAAHDEDQHSAMVGRFLAGFLDRSDGEAPCLGAFSATDTGTITAATVVIRAETSGRLREACIEEELSQSFGLTNDDPAVRPSIFNDTQEFALLTTHDAYLMRILYDPRLRPGMGEAEVRHVLPEIIADLDLPSADPEADRRAVLDAVAAPVASSDSDL